MKGFWVSLKQTDELTSTVSDIWPAHWSIGFNISQLLNSYPTSERVTGTCSSSFGFTKV
jgi:hypothetical protein